MIVMKFGGTSLGSAPAIRNVLSIVQREQSRDPVLVVSAHSGVTNQLVDLGKRAPEGEPDTDAIVQRHRELCAELDVPFDVVESLLAELHDLARGMQLVGEASPRAYDYLLSFGERCSSRILAQFFRQNGIEARAIEAGDVGLVTDSRYGRARPEPDAERIRREIGAVDGVPIVTGFIGRDPQGNVTTLGRNGSDFSAALFGEALNADEIQIWTDVDGVLSADPSIVSNAELIDEMAFDEASEVAYYGGRVLHPATIQPAMRSGIPVRVCNTHAPDGAGTLVVQRSESARRPVRAIVYKEGLNLVSVVSPRMLMQSGYLARVFGLAAEHEIDVGLVATSEVSITMTTDATELASFVAGLEELGEVLVESDQALVGVVGTGIADSNEIPGQVLTTLAQEGIRVRVVSQGAIRVNVAFVVAGDDVAHAVRALHGRFFGSA